MGEIKSVEYAENHVCHGVSHIFNYGVLYETRYDVNHDLYTPRLDVTGFRPKNLDHHLRAIRTTSTFWSVFSTPSR